MSRTLEVLLGELRVPTAHAVRIGRVSAGRSTVLEVARARARERAVNPKWYAGAARVKMVIDRNEYVALRDAGAVEG
ncbi:hypothetical protein ACLESD_17630 [Pyxidicoccus sp. 3LFB2]